tara:strand:- start:4197 stop:4847 length:651 start_codon:yes stop_codon:yes gene_type:complete
MTEAPGFKTHKISLQKKSINLKYDRPSLEDLELYKHDMLTSLHAIRLGIAHLKGNGNNLDLISAIEDELSSLMRVTEENFVDKKMYFAEDLANCIKKFFLFAYPEIQWQRRLKFKVDELGHRKICVYNLKQILRNLCANFRENGNQKIAVELRCDHSFHLRIISYSEFPKKIDGNPVEGKGLRSIRQMLKKSNGFFYFDILEDCVVQELIFPTLKD